MNEQVPPSPEYITKEELAARLRVTPRTIEHWMRKRLIPHLKIGRTARFRADHVDAALKNFERWGQS